MVLDRNIGGGILFRGRKNSKVREKFEGRVKNLRVRKASLYTVHKKKACAQ
jgi:hypothetical protein